MYKFILSLLTSMIITTSHVHAGFFIEPYLGSEFSNLNCKLAHNGSDCGGKYSSLLLGSRFAYKNTKNIWFAFDTQTNVAGKFRSSNSSIESADYIHSTIGTAIGYELKNNFRFYGSISLLDSLFQKNTSDDETIYSDGTGFKLGMGYKMLPKILINLEIGSYNFKTMDGSDQEEELKTSDYFKTFSYTYTALTLSYFFTFGKK